jgi:hypothetical protein
MLTAESIYNNWSKLPNCRAFTESREWSPFCNYAKQPDHCGEAPALLLQALHAFEAEAG